MSIIAANGVSFLFFSINKPLCFCNFLSMKKIFILSLSSLFPAFFFYLLFLFLIFSFSFLSIFSFFSFLRMKENFSHQIHVLARPRSPPRPSPHAHGFPLARPSPTAPTQRPSIAPNSENASNISDRISKASTLI